jgi:hypothetical protein
MLSIRIADDNGFLSRQPRKTAAVPARKRRVYRTGRNRNFSMKATNEAVERFYKMADERKVTLGALLELALDALEKAAPATNTIRQGRPMASQQASQD